MCEHPKLKANCPQLPEVSSLPYLPDLINLYHLTTKSDISNYVAIEDV